ncbi:MAG: DUF2341 domain-containing protein, partial [Candidatus Aenigmatarchaeota archaeon]
IFPSAGNPDAPPADNSGDIRITKDDGTTLLSLWVDRVLGTSPNRTAWIWFKLPKTPNVNQDVYVYYGNSNATNVSSWNDVILPYIDRFVANAGWRARYAHTSVVFNNKIWVIGGYDGSYKNDVWYSSDGINWTQATSNAGWSARYSHSSVVFNNKIWVIGGYDGSYKNDVWYSSDGINWTQATSNAGWNIRYGHSSVVFNNKMWVMGGWTGSSFKNDVWACITNWFSTDPAFSSAGVEENPSFIKTSFFSFNQALTPLSKTTMSNFNILNFLSKKLLSSFDIQGLVGAPAKIKAIIKSVKTRFRIKSK